MCILFMPSFAYLYIIVVYHTLACTQESQRNIPSSGRSEFTHVSVFGYIHLFMHMSK